MSDDRSSKPIVGYKNPPLKTRFEKGRSGNPNGRPRGTRNYTSILERWLDKKVPNSERWARRKSKRGFIIANIVDSAIDGDLRSLKLVWKYMQKFDNRPETARTKILPVNSKALAAFKRAAAGLDSKSEKT